jgi:hypothetical protein
MSNIPGIVYLLMLWLSKGEKLKAKLDTFDPASKTTEPFFDKSGNLLPKDVLPRYKSRWFRLKICYDNNNRWRSVPQALFSLMTDGRELEGGDLSGDTRRVDGISFHNMFNDLFQCGHKDIGSIRQAVTEMLSESPMAWARKLLCPTDADLKPKAAPKAAKKSREAEDEESDQESWYNLLAKGRFGFTEAEMKRMFDNNLKGQTESANKVRKELDKQISIHAEKLVRLTLARAAEEYVNIHDKNHTAFGQVYVQTDDQKSGNSDAVASALSKDISLFLIATFHHSFVLYRD